MPNASNNNPGRGQPVLGFDAQRIPVLIGAGLLRRIAHKSQKHMPTINNAENAGPATAAATNPTLNPTPAAGQGAPDLQVSLAASTPAASPELGASPKLACELPLPRGGGSRRFRNHRECLPRPAAHF